MIMITEIFKDFAEQLSHFVVFGWHYDWHPYMYVVEEKVLVPKVSLHDIYHLNL